MIPKIVLIDSYRGYNFFIKKRTLAHIGSYFCGYVKILKDKFPDDTDWRNKELSVHGGITFAQNDDEDSDKFVIGFDCAHFRDTIQKCNLEYVIKECKSLIDQIIIEECKNEL